MTRVIYWVAATVMLGYICGYLALLAKQSDPPRRFAGCLLITKCTFFFWIFVILALTAKG